MAMLGMDAATKKEIEKQKEARYTAVRATLGRHDSTRPDKVVTRLSKIGKISRRNANFWWARSKKKGRFRQIVT